VGGGVVGVGAGELVAAEAVELGEVAALFPDQGNDRDLLGRGTLPAEFVELVAYAVEELGSASGDQSQMEGMVAETALAVDSCAGLGVRLGRAYLLLAATQVVAFGSYPAGQARK
jgi:hypothetical protein